MKGNGGGIRLKAASAAECVVFLILRLAASRCLAGASRSSPASPALFPIQNVIAAPASDPAVARSATAHQGVRPRIENTIVAASTPNGSQKNSVESSAARIRMPAGFVKVVRTQCVIARI